MYFFSFFVYFYRKDLIEGNVEKKLGLFEKFKSSTFLKMGEKFYTFPLKDRSAETLNSKCMVKWQQGGAKLRLSPRTI